MNRDDIIRVARQVADPDTTDPLCGGDYRDLITLNLDEMVRFAALVAAAERDKQTQIADNIESALEDLVSYCNNVDLGHIDEVLAAEDALVAAYRARGEK